VSRRAWRLPAAGATFWPAWLPDSRTIVAIDPRGRALLVDVMTGRGTPLDGSPLGILNAQMHASPDGARLYYTERRYEANVWMMEAAKPR
jgi:hypothetical protein